MSIGLLQLPGEHHVASAGKMISHCIAGPRRRQRNQPYLDMGQPNQIRPGQIEPFMSRSGKLGKRYQYAGMSAHRIATLSRYVVICCKSMAYISIYRYCDGMWQGFRL